MTVMRADPVGDAAAGGRAARRAGRVLHVIKRHGEMSQPFIVDALTAAEQCGWEPWILSKLEPLNPDLFPHPAPARVLRPRRPPTWRRALNRGLRRNARARTAYWWRPQVARARPDLIHIHFGWTAAEVRLRALKVPVLVSFHGSDVNAWPHRDPRNRAAYDELFAELPRATAVSNFIAGRLRGLGFQGDIDLLPAGVHLDEFPFRGPAAAGGPPLLLYVGRHVPCKGLDVLLRAMPKLLSAEPDLRLEVIGHGPEEAAHRALAERLGVGRQVAFRGARPRPDVVEALRRATVLVVPSRVTAVGEAEGSPVVPKEAQAVGVPVVATRVGGLPETVAPELRHELVPPEDPRALAAQVTRLLADPQRCARGAHIGRRFVEDEFDWRLLGRRLDRIYESLLDDPAQKRAGRGAVGGA